MSNRHKLNKKCSKCGTQLLDKNKSGFCNKHIDRRGCNNPFYQKVHSEKTLQKLKISCCKASKELWKDETYRNKVIKGVSKPRKKGFKAEQATRIKQWYANHPEQKILRAEKMKESWRLNKITKTPKAHSNTSKIEKEFFNALKEYLPIIERKAIHIDSKWFFPDGLIKNDKIIFEFYGNYWHANPTMTTKDKIIKGRTALEIWEADKERIKQLEKNGYIVHIIWEADYKKNKNQVIQTCVDIVRFEWESCSL